MIRFENVTFGYGAGRPVLTEFALEIPDGGRICIAGPSGAGKTTVLRLLLGLEKPRRGRITGTEGLRFSAVFQEDRLIPDRTAVENIAMFSNEATARRVLAELGLEEAGDSLPGELSGGQRRRVALARALAHPCDVLVLDEALTGLDEATTERCLAVIRRASEGKTLVMVTHDARRAEALGARTVALTPLCT